MTYHVKEGEPHFTEGIPVEYKRVYLWNWVVRSMHWISALSIVVLFVTGFYIGRPYFMSGGEAIDHFLMGRFRFAHFAAAAVLVATAMIRVYWLFVGNRYERWNALLPYRKEDFVNGWMVLKKYVFLEPWRAPHYLGHNPLQQVIYTLLYAVAIVQVFTGFYMYGLADPGGFFFTAFAWVGALFGGAQVVRVFHHILTWFWPIFLPLHIYLTVRADVVHQESRISSMVGGGRYVRSDIEFIDD
jgi:Ni/Fe-hydrogenase b-type cytochrome subunit